MSIRLPALTVLGAAAAAILAITGSPSASAADAVRLPSPPAEKALRGAQVAVLAGGCFWGMEGVFEHVKGVTSVTTGYAGGTKADANYDAVSSERTGHAEAVRIVYNPAQVSYGTLLKVFFSVAHDPTQLNRQYPDTGPSYRSAIFPQNPQQRQIAAAYIADIGKAKAFGKPVVTKIETGAFYPAEAYHQDFMRRNPNHGYITRYDKPKVAALKTAYPSLYHS